MALGEHIRARRRERGLTAATLAELAQISRAHLSEIERGHVVNPSAAVLQRLADALGTTTADLLGNPAPARAEQPLPLSLRQYAELESISPEDLAMLAAIRYRGTQPARIADWRYLHESIRRSMSHLGGDGAEDATDRSPGSSPRKQKSPSK